MKEIIDYIESKLMGYALSLCDYHIQNAEDLKQDTLYKLFLHWDVYKHKSFSEQYKIATVIMKNTRLDFFKSPKSKVKYQNEFPESELHPTFDLDIDKKAILDFMSKSDKNHFKITLDVIKGYKMREIAEARSIPINTVVGAQKYTKLNLIKHFEL